MNDNGTHMVLVKQYYSNSPIVVRYNAYGCCGASGAGGCCGAGNAMPPTKVKLICLYLYTHLKFFPIFSKITLHKHSVIICLSQYLSIIYTSNMSNSQIIPASSASLLELKNKYIELITNGYSESVALAKLDFPKALYIKLLVEDRDFIKDVEEARKIRADFWVSKIAETVDFDYSKDEVGSERLKFDKLQFLAKADNPDRYGNNSKKVDISIDLKQFKLLKPEEAVKALASDPFAVEAEYTEVEKDEDIL